MSQEKKGGTRLRPPERRELAPLLAIAVVLVLFTLFAVWVLLSVIAYPDRTEISYNITWGQGAVTIMLFAVMYLTLKSLI